MRQISFEQELDNLRRQFTRELADATRTLDARLQTLEAPTFDPTSYVSPPNYLPNSHPEWSKDAYTAGTTVTPSTAGDGNRECYNWYRQTSVTTALSAAAATALKRSVPSAQHSLWAANEGTNSDIPIWDGTNGTFLLGSSNTNYDIACPLPTDFVFPGQRFYVYFEVSLGDVNTSKSANQRFYAGFWDNTTGQQKWIEGSDFTPTASVYGAEGSRTLEYKIFAETDSGDEILSAAVPVTNAPATLTAENHIRLSYSGAPGFIRYVIYRKDGSNFFRVGETRNSIDLQFFDTAETGSTVVPVSNYPTVTGNRPRAYAETREFRPGTLSSTSFTPHQLTIQVPLQYNRNNTTNGNQWFRFGLTQLVAGGDEREFVIRRISVSEGFGSWTRSPRDMQATNGPTTSATSAPTTGTTTPNPSEPGTGSPTCVVLDTMTKVLRGDEIIEMPVGDLEKGDMLWSGQVALRIKRFREGEVAETLLFRTENGSEVRCTPDHLIITGYNDLHGTPARYLHVGDEVMTLDASGRITLDVITSRQNIVGQVPVRGVVLDAPHFWLTGGIVSHNNKPVLPPES